MVRKGSRVQIPAWAPGEQEGIIKHMKRLVLSQTDKKIAGLCGGIAKYIDVDPTVVRLIVLTIIIMTGVLPGVLLYAVAVAITPKEGATK